MADADLIYDPVTGNLIFDPVSSDLVHEGSVAPASCPWALGASPTPLYITVANQIPLSNGGFDIDTVANEDDWVFNASGSSQCIWQQTDQDAGWNSTDKWRPWTLPLTPPVPVIFLDAGFWALRIYFERADIFDRVLGMWRRAAEEPYGLYLWDDDPASLIGAEGENILVTQ